MNQPRLRRSGSAALALLSISSLAFAQQTPDAGSLLRDQPRALTLQPTPAKPVLPATPAPAQEVSGPKILVKGFLIQGATLIPETELYDQLQAALGQELSLSQLQGVRDVLTRYYSTKGYLARVILPEQDIKNGIVVIQIVEGLRGGVRIDGKGERLDQARIQAFVDQRLPAGEPMNLAALHEALTILNEQPGVAARAELAAGQADRTVDVVVSAQEQPLVRHGLQFNNQGSRATGEYQITGKVSLANPSGRFDAGSLMLNAAEGSTFLRADYSIALGDRGLRIGANASHLDYKIVQGSLQPLDAKGNATTVGLSAAYPLLRRSDATLSLSFSLDQKRLRDTTVAGETGNRRVNVASLGLLATRISPSDGANISYGASVSAGDTDLASNATAFASDQLSRRTQGSFAKLAWNLGLAQPLSSTWTLFASARGQFTNDNLDSSERLSVGGPNGVRAYPASEAAADQGWLANLSVAYQLNPNAALSLFVDGARVNINRNTWVGWNTGNPQQPNRYDLLGAGVGLAWKLAKNAALNASIAAPIGSNPGRDANGNDSEGSRRNARGWITLSTQF